MSVGFKKILKKSPINRELPGKYYPTLVVTGKSVSLDDLAYKMKEKSSLTLGDIKSVLINFVESMRETLYTGSSVNVENFGVFSLSARTTGVEDRKDCTAKLIQSVKINFRSSSNVRPDTNTTRAGERIDFFDIENLLESNSEGNSDVSGGNGTGGGSTVDPDDIVVDPSV